MNAFKFKKIPWQKITSLLGIGVLFWLFLQVDITTIFSLWQTSNKLWILAAMVVLLFQLSILTIKWAVLIDEKISFSTLFKIRMIGAFFGTITPANAGTVVRAHYLKKATGIGFIKTTSSVVLDKLLEITVIAILGIVSISVLSVLLIDQNVISGLLATAVITFALIMAGTVWLLTDKKYGKKALKTLSSLLLPRKVQTILKPYFNKVHPHLLSVDKLVLPFILNVAAYAASYVYVLTLVWAIGAQLDYFHIFITLPLSSLIALLPITISGIGTREATTVFLWGLFGVTPEQTLAIMLLSFFIGRGIPTLLGWVFLSNFKPKSSSSPSEPVATD